MHAEYIIGNGPAPPWCANLLSPYMRGDGSVGYEFRGALKDFSLCIGDVLILNGRIISVRREAERLTSGEGTAVPQPRSCDAQRGSRHIRREASAYESEGFYAPDQKAGQDD